MPRFRTRPVEIDAVRYVGNGNVKDERGPDWLFEALESGTVVSSDTGGDPLVIHTLEGDHVCSPGDYIIRGVKGELYPCKPDIFAKTYDEVVPRLEPALVDGVPRRQRLDLLTDAEKAIMVAVDEVEELVADLLLTDAVTLLDQARNKVADFVEKQSA